jgi:hypothetical protein
LTNISIFSKRKRLKRNFGRPASQWHPRADGGSFGAEMMNYAIASFFDQQFVVVIEFVCIKARSPVFCIHEDASLYREIRDKI